MIFPKQNLTNPRKLIFVIVLLIFLTGLTVVFSYTPQFFSNYKILLAKANLAFLLLILPIVYLSLPFVIWKRKDNPLTKIYFNASLKIYILFPFILFFISFFTTILFKIFVKKPLVLDTEYFLGLWNLATSSFYEEVVFRGILIGLGFIIFRNVWKSKSVILPFLSATLFTFYHLPDYFFGLKDISALLGMVFALGWLFSCVFIKTKKLYYPIFAHYLFNLSMVLFRIYL